MWKNSIAFVAINYVYRDSWKQLGVVLTCESEHRMLQNISLRQRKMAHRKVSRVYFVSKSVSHCLPICCCFFFRSKIKFRQPYKLQ